MKKVLFSALCLMLFVNVFADSRSFSSPDGKIVVVVSDTDGTPDYTVTYDGNAFILSSPLGLNTSLGDFTSGMTLLPEQEAPKLVEEQYSVKIIRLLKLYLHLQRMKDLFMMSYSVFPIVTLPSDIRCILAETLFLQ